MATEIRIRRPVPPPRRIDADARPRSVAVLVLQTVIRLIVAAVFVYAARGKIENPAGFAKEIRLYGLAPVEATNLMAAIIPWMEVLGPLLLLVGFLRSESRGWLLLMLAVFTAVKIYALMRHMNISCGCVPADSPLKVLFEGWTGVLTNVGLIAMLVVDGILDRPPRPHTASLPDGRGYRTVDPA